MSFITAKTKRLCGLLQNSAFLVCPSCTVHTRVTCAEQGQSTTGEGEQHLWIQHVLSPSWAKPADVPQGTNATWAEGSGPCFPVGTRLALLFWFYSYGWHFSLLINAALMCYYIKKLQFCFPRRLFCIVVDLCRLQLPGCACSSTPSDTISLFFNFSTEAPAGLSVIFIQMD